jgi:hypothetical protein
VPRDPQSHFDFGVDEARAPNSNPPLRQAITAFDDMPPGPYSVGVTYWWGGDGVAYHGQPFTVTCGDGRAIAGHVESRDCADKIAAALNLAYPLMSEDANRGRLTLADIEALEEQFPGDMLAGYRDGLNAEPWPEKEPSPAYEHGRRNGVNDRNHTRDEGEDPLLLAREMRLAGGRRRG